ncbi:MAG TPA: cytochrome P460 family protein [Bryobacteraceae bacterium]|nr:cytochrome P460 family protein [Bryobacteraceae bacterium]
MRTAVTILLSGCAAVILFAQQTSDTQRAAGEPHFTRDNQLVVPTDYREWIFLSSGLGMTYGPLGEANGNRAPRFDNVFVTPAAYRAFLATGKWPEKTMFVLEVRSSVSKGSINNGGHYQSDREGFEAEVKDSSRFPGNGWAFFALGSGGTAKMIPRSASCYSCHPDKGAVDNTFVQFYPTLLPIAKAKGTLTAAYLAGSGEGR